MYKPLRTLFSAAVIGALAFGSRADAALVMTIDDGIAPLITVMDNGVGDANPDLGIITWQGPTSGITTNSITGLVGKGPNTAFLDLLALHATTGAGGSLTIQLLDDGFSLGTVGGAELLSTVGGTTSASGQLTSSAELDTSNNLPYVSGPTTSIGPLGGLVFGDMTTAGFVYGGGPFSLTRTVSITIGSNEVMSYNSFAEVIVPEPATLAYVGLSLGVLGLRRRRRSA